MCGGGGEYLKPGNPGTRRDKLADILFCSMAQQRDVQAMLVGKYVGKGNGLEVFHIPPSRMDEFMQAVRDNDAKTEHAGYSLEKTFYRDGFVNSISRDASSSGAQQSPRSGSFDHRLAEVQAAMAIDHRNKVGWRSVPMRSSSVVVWLAGLPHRVTGATRKGHTNAYRTVCYTRVSKTPPSKFLPKTFSIRFGRTDSGNTRNDAVEKQLATEHPIWGWSQETIGRPHWGLFSENPSDPQQPLKTWDELPICVDALARDGFAVIDMPADVGKRIDAMVTATVRQTVFDKKRKHACADTCASVSRMSNEQLARDLYDNKTFQHAKKSLKRMRYFARNTTGTFTAEGEPMTNLRGVQGLTNTSAMLDVHQHPEMAAILADIHGTLRCALGWSRMYYLPERMSWRGYMSTKLGTHTDNRLADCHRFFCKPPPPP